ncbi:MAG: RagB/SusD family nutrient uptake outer membrane protein, partial [Pedobacter sp.]
MKLKTQHIYTVAAIAMLTITFSCKKDFLEKPSKNEPTLETYYDNAAQVRGATGLLYNSIWYEYQDKAFHAIGEVLSGNMYTGDPKYNTFMNFSIS